MRSEHADGVVVGVDSQRQRGAAARPHKPLPAGQAVFLFKALESCHSQHAQRQRPVNVLVLRGERCAEKGKVKRHLAQKAEQQKPPKVAFDVVGVQKALHGQKAEDGKGQPPDIPQHTVCRQQGADRDATAAGSTGGEGRQQDTGFDAGSADVINEHGDAGDVFERCAAESAADRGFGSLGHKESLT